MTTNTEPDITFYRYFFETLLRAIYCCVVPCFLCITCYGADSSVSVGDCLNAYKRYIANFESCSFLFHEHVEGEDIQTPAGMFESTSNSASYFINKKNSNGGFVESIEKNYFNGRKIHIVKYSGTDTVIFKTNTLSTDNVIARDDFEIFRSDLSFAPLLGYLSLDFSRNEKILDIIQKNNFSARTVKENNVVNILCEGNVGKIRLGFLFAPDYGYALTKITLTNETAGTFVGYKSLTMKFEDFLRYGKDQIFFFPSKLDVSYTAVATSLQQNGQGKVIEVPYTQSGTRVCSLSNFKANKATKKELPLLSNITDGTKVIVEDVPQIEYVWLDGKIVPKTDEVMLAIARGGHKFMPGPNESRFWMMAVGVALIIFACGKKGYDYYKSRKAR